MVNSSYIASASVSAVASTPIPVNDRNGQPFQLRASSASNRRHSNRQYARPTPIAGEDMSMLMINSGTRTTSSSSSSFSSAAHKTTPAMAAAATTIKTHKDIPATLITVPSLGSRKREREQRDELEDIKSTSGRRQPPIRPTAPPMKDNQMTAAVAPITPTTIHPPTDAALRVRFGLPPKKEKIQETRTSISLSSSRSTAITATAAAAAAAAHKHIPATATAVVAPIKALPATSLTVLTLDSCEREYDYEDELMEQQRDDLEDLRSAGRRRQQQQYPSRPPARPTDAAMRVRFGLPPKKEEMKKKEVSSSMIASPSSTAVVAAVDAVDVSSSSFRTTASALPSSTTCSTSTSTNITSPTSTATTTTSTSTSSSIIDNTIKSLNQLLPIPLSSPKMPGLFSCTGGSSAYHNLDDSSVIEKLNTTTKNYDYYTTKTNRKQRYPSKTTRHHQINKQLLLTLTSSHTKDEEGRGSEWQSGRTTPTTLSTTTSSITYDGDYEDEDEQEGNSIDRDEKEGTTIATTAAELSPRIMMFYQDEVEDEEEDTMMNAPALQAPTMMLSYSSSSSSSSQPPSSKLASFADIALALVLDDDTNDHDTDDDDDDDGNNTDNKDDEDTEWGIFLSFSEEEHQDQDYHHASSSSPSSHLTFNLFPPPPSSSNMAAVATKTAGFAFPPTPLPTTSRTLAC